MSRWKSFLGTASVVTSSLMLVVTNAFAQATPVTSTTGSTTQNNNQTVTYDQKLPKSILTDGTLLLPGKIMGVNGTQLTVLGTDNKTYTVDVSKAVSQVNGQTVTSPEYKLNDPIFLIGTPDAQGSTKLNARNISNVQFTDDFVQKFLEQNPAQTGTQTPPVTYDQKLPKSILNDGTLLLPGKIMGVNGTQLTVLGTDNKTYTVDASKAVSQVNGQTVTSPTYKLNDPIFLIGTPDAQGSTKLNARNISNVQFTDSFVKNFLAQNPGQNSSTNTSTTTNNQSNTTATGSTTPTTPSTTTTTGNSNTSSSTTGNNQSTSNTNVNPENSSNDSDVTSDNTDQGTDNSGNVENTTDNADQSDNSGHHYHHHGDWQDHHDSQWSNGNENLKSASDSQDNSSDNGDNSCADNGSWNQDGGSDSSQNNATSSQDNGSGDQGSHDQGSESSGS